MDDVTKAKLKIARGCLGAANAVASGLGYGALSFVTGNHRRTPAAMRMATFMFEKSQRTIRDGVSDLECAKRNAR